MGWGYGGTPLRPRGRATSYALVLKSKKEKKSRQKWRAKEDWIPIIKKARFCK